MAYDTSGTDLLKFYDARTLGDLIGDSGTRVASGSLAAHANVVAAMAAARGQVKAALFQAKRYTDDYLDALADDGMALLDYLTCKVAFKILWERRPWCDSRERAEKDANDVLEQLRTGRYVLDSEDQKEAGLPKITGPTRVELQNLNLWVDRARGHYYPERVLPNNR